jgi:hypothetical protein
MKRINIRGLASGNKPLTTRQVVAIEELRNTLLNMCIGSEDLDPVGRALSPILNNGASLESSDRLTSMMVRSLKSISETLTGHLTTSLADVVKSLDDFTQAMSVSRGELVRKEDHYSYALLADSNIFMGAYKLVGGIAKNSSIYDHLDRAITNVSVVDESSKKVIDEILNIINPLVEAAEMDSRSQQFTAGSLKVFLTELVNVTTHHDYDNVRNADKRLVSMAESGALNSIVNELSSDATKIQNDGHLKKLSAHVDKLAASVNVDFDSANDYTKLRELVRLVEYLLSRTVAMLQSISQELRYLQKSYGKL